MIEWNNAIDIKDWAMISATVIAGAVGGIMGILGSIFVFRLNHKQIERQAKRVTLNQLNYTFAIIEEISKSEYRELNWDLIYDKKWLANLYYLPIIKMKDYHTIVSWYKNIECLEEDAKKNNNLVSGKDAEKLLDTLGDEIYMIIVKLEGLKAPPFLGTISELLLDIYCVMKLILHRKILPIMKKEINILYEKSIDLVVSRIRALNRHE